MKLFLVRHGQSIGNVFTDMDLPDSPLTPVGSLQAEKVAELLSRQSVTRIISSPLIRAMQTAQPLSRALAIPIEVWTNLYEYREGPAHIGPKVEILQQIAPEAVFPDDMEEQGWYYPGGENLQSVKLRAESVVGQLNQYSDDCIALFAHGMLNEVIIREILQISELDHIQFEQKNTSVSWFEMDGNTIKVREMNHTEHLSFTLQT